MEYEMQVIANDMLIINGERINYPNNKHGGHTIVQYDRRLFVDGWEWKDGKWKRSVLAFLKCLFA